MSLYDFAGQRIKSGAVKKTLKKRRSWTRDLCLVAPGSHTLLGYIFNFLNVGVKREGR